MEALVVLLNDPAAFNAAVHGGLPSGNDISIITKNKAMVGGAAGAVITWTAVGEDGKEVTAQYSIGVRHLMNALGILSAAYDDQGFPRR